MSFAKASTPVTRGFWINRFPWNISFMWQIIPKRFQMLQTWVNTWLHSSCYHCPFWFPLASFPWDQGDLFLVRSCYSDRWLVQTESHCNSWGWERSPPQMGQHLGVPRHCSAQGALKTAQDPQGDAWWNSQKAAWVPVVGITHILLLLLAQ